VATLAREVDVPVQKNRGHGGKNWGTYAASETTAWNDLTATDFTSTTATALAAGDYFVGLLVTNTHATQTLHLQLKTGAGAAADGHLIPAGEFRVFDDLVGGGGGASITTISIYGSAAATTGQIEAWFNSGGS